ncbi:type VI secretion system protein ImpL [Silvimonas terrae]|uniref:Type VI secretion system protein ImpL n=1 Tax=Silvimonas terrae TaxID=300266 RepID=A0A840RJP2_9NEIS|nr:ImcF-related family protein [Silvimonas terrae]MBB5192804.1 type VI secretion system protein ImpL [Silvimonas terrae]
MLTKLNFKYLGLALLLVGLVGAIYIFGSYIGLDTPDQKKSAAAILVAGVTVVMMCLQAGRFYSRRTQAIRATGTAKVGDKETERKQAEAEKARQAWHTQLHQYLSTQYSWLERRRKTWLFVLGDQRLVRNQFPYLIEQQWLDTPQAVLVWAGVGSVAPKGGWSRLRGWWRRPAAGIVLVADGITAAGDEPAQLAQACGFALPVQLLLAPPLPGHRAEEAAPVVLASGSGLRGGVVPGLLQRLVRPLAQSGIAAVLQAREASFDARLSRWLEAEHTPLGRWFTRMTDQLHRRQRLHGVWFAPTRAAVSSPSQEGGAELADDPAGYRAREAGRAVVLPPSWLGLFGRVRQPRVRFSRLDIFWFMLTGCALAVMVWLLMVWQANRILVQQVRTDVTALHNARILAEGLPALVVLQNDMTLLESRIARSSWWSQLGLQHDAALLNTLWQPYGLAANKWLMQPVQFQLARQLKALDAVPLDGAADPDSGTSGADAVGQAGYDTLKTWLMLVQPGHADSGFLSPRLAGVGKVVWPAQPGDRIEQIAAFYAKHLAAHPQWRLAGDESLLFSARQTLSGLIDVKQAEDTLYHQLLDETKARYPDPTMSALLGGRDSRGLWSVQGRLPGTFTRQAYEGYVKDNIERLSKQTATSGDWVLGQQTARTEEKPEDIAAALNRRYFADFGHAWQAFLNRIVWVPASNLSGNAEQLRVYADAQQSPLAGLMKTIAWQAQTGAQAHSLADSLVDKARSVFKGKEDNPAQPPAQTTPKDSVPLADAFGPLLRLVSEGNGTQATDNTLSLQRYLDRVSATRLKLDQVSAAADPDAFARQLAQNLFQGRASDLVDARDYAQLVAASLGSGYAGMGQNLFLEPLDQGWRTLIRPAAASLDSLWQTSIVLPFNSTFSGRYPFNDSDADASLADLARFLGPQGNVAQFASTQLAGILEKQGDQWVPNPLYAQAMRFDPEFLNALNKLTWLSGQLYAEGDLKTRFSLMALGDPQVTDSQLNIDGQMLHYFNQKPKWQDVTWPGNPLTQRGLLTWDALATGLRKQNDFAGPWGFIRLLAKAKTEQINKSDWRINWALDDGVTLHYLLRTQSGSGPLALLQLDHFKLPQRLFGASNTKPVATRASAVSGSSGAHADPAS